MRTLLILLVAGCTEGPFEGDDPGECTDGADNDLDGAFDCADVDCLGAPACADGGGGDGTGGGGGGDGTGAQVPAGLRSVTVTYTQSHDIGAGDPTVDQLACDSYDLCDCVMVFEGAGTLVETSGAYATFEGTFTRTNDGEDGSCAEAFRAGTWVPEDGVSFHTFLFDRGATELDHWIAHAKVEDVDPPEGTSHVAAEVFTIWDMFAVVQGGNYVEHTESSQGVIQIFTDEVEHDLEITFVTE